MGIDIGSIVRVEGIEWTVVAVTPTEVIARSITGRLLRLPMLLEEALDRCQDDELPWAA